MGLIALQFNHGNKRISTRNTGNPETNGFSSAQNGNMTDGQFVETRLNVLDEEANHAVFHSVTSCGVMKLELGARQEASEQLTYVWHV
ncbi:hypothetical protein AVEN_86035-1 [Araneus ventricosus]|uniref:Uncharacterized protein n=1 Tax=Araneus ventricosus TaxID=182803 RepID=A0A4Y2PNQ4_ARAVE|nr:hypothetical protein AVEN_86035-1 [Araneus ventricosus]